jgi:hypothetical protein
MNKVAATLCVSTLSVLAALTLARAEPSHRIGRGPVETLASTLSAVACTPPGLTVR